MKKCTDDNLVTVSGDANGSLMRTPTAGWLGHQKQKEFLIFFTFLVTDQYRFASTFTLIKAPSPIQPHKSATQAVLHYWPVAGYIIAIYLGKGIANAAVFFVF
jgi:hypothetical protein